jgi:hypothetical protein
MVTDEQHMALDEAVSENPTLVSINIDDLSSASSLLLYILNGAINTYEADDPLSIPGNINLVLQENPELWQLLKDAYRERKYARIRDSRALPFSSQSCSLIPISVHA